MRILNLYAGIGGNRKLWPDNVEVTAVEIDSQIAKIYSHFFPKDKMVVGDAHQYLLDHFREFDFIWSSVPCYTHTAMQFPLLSRGQISYRYPDMSLYQEVIFCKQFVKCPWVIENVKPYYYYLIQPKEVGRHAFWSNFIIPNMKVEGGCIWNNGGADDVRKKEIRKGFIIPKGIYTKSHPEQLLNNCVEPELGLAVFNAAFKDKQTTLFHDSPPKGVKG